MNQPRSGRRLPDWLLGLGALLTLATLVVAQSIYQLLAGNPEFVAVRLTRPAHLLEVVAVFNFLPAAGLFLAWAACQRLDRRLARGFLAAVFFAFALAFFWQLHNAYFDTGAGEGLGRAYWLWLIPAAALAWLARRRQELVLSSLATLGPVALVLPALFLSQTWPSRPVESPEEGAGPAAASRPAARRFPPIVIVVFDEFTLHALRDPAGRIDARRFPNFAALARTSYWFRNATSNASHTHFALPALVTGNLPTGAPGDASGVNLFTWLEPYYDITIYERHTGICATGRFRCPQTEWAVEPAELLQDVFFLYATRVVPRRLDLGLPDVRRTWGAFRPVRDDMAIRRKGFDEFLDALDAAPPENSLFFFYTLLPHSPYVLQPDGRLDDRRYAYLAFQESMAGSPALLGDLRDRYFLQVGFVDTLVGRLVARLKQRGLFDSTLLVITADHGVSWDPAAPGRILTRENAPLILSVPFFLKLPGQTRGQVSDADAQHIDLLPTLAEALKLELPGPRQGRSLFAPKSAPRRKVAYDPRNGLLEFPDTLGLAPLDFTLEAPAVASSVWLGRRVADFEVVPLAAGRARVFPVAVLSGAEPVVYVAGQLDPELRPARVVVAVNGEIVADTSDFRGPLWSVSFPARALRAETNVVSAYAVLAGEDRRLLALPAPANRTLPQNAGR